MTKIKLSPAFIGFLQATGLVAYVALVATIMLNGNAWFGNMDHAGILGPILFLSLFVFSAITSAAIMTAYPFYVFWERKDFKLAAKIVFASAAWLLLFILATILILLSIR